MAVKLKRVADIVESLIGAALLIGTQENAFQMARVYNRGNTSSLLHLRLFYTNIAIYILVLYLEYNYIGAMC